MLTLNHCYCIQAHPLDPKVNEVFEKAKKGSLPWVPIKLGDPLADVFEKISDIEIIRGGALSAGTLLIDYNKDKKVNEIQEVYGILPIDLFPPSGRNPNIRHYRPSGYHLYVLPEGDLTRLILSTKPILLG